MAIVCPLAEYRQLPGKSTTLFTPRFVNWHTMVGTLAGTESWFTPSGRAYSHFGTGGSGALWQWQDLQYRAASDLQGNPYSISFENEDRGSHFPSWSGSNVPPFTDAQLETLIEATAWCCVRFGIPPVLLTNSLPIPDGLSYHRLGIDPWRVDGGLLYSSSTGKVCPGDVRINQMKEVVPDIAALVNPGDWLDMVTESQLRTIIREEVGKEFTTGGDATRTAILELATRGVFESAWYYGRRENGDGSVYVVLGSHTGKLRLGVALWEWASAIHRLNNIGSNPQVVSIPDEAFDRIPDLG